MDGKYIIDGNAVYEIDQDCCSKKIKKTEKHEDENLEPGRNRIECIYLME